MKVILDFEIRTIMVMPAQRPSIVVIDIAKCTTTIVDTTLDWNVNNEDDEKNIEYQDLKIEMQEL